MKDPAPGQPLLTAAVAEHRRALAAYRENSTTESLGAVLDAAALVTRAAIELSRARVERRVRALHFAAAILKERRAARRTTTTARACPRLAAHRRPNGRRAPRVNRAAHRVTRARAPGRPGDDGPSPLADRRRAPIGGASR